jgi:hypothetical protein
VKLIRFGDPHKEKPGHFIEYGIDGLGRALKRVVAKGG